MSADGTDRASGAADAGWSPWRRVVGDGGCNFEIVDIAVHPDFRRRGLGRRIMTSLMDRLRATAPASAYVSLIADGASPALYAEFGFAPTAPASIGMGLRL